MEPHHLHLLLQNSSLPSTHHAFLTKFTPQFLVGRRRMRSCKSGKRASVLMRAHNDSASSTLPPSQDTIGRRQLVAVGATVPGFMILSHSAISFAAESKKGFLPVTDKNDGYSFIYPFGWQEVTIEGQDKVFKDVIEPLESVSVTIFPTNKEDIRDFGSPKEVAETLIKKVFSPTTQKTKLIDAKEQDFEGKAYYTFEYVAQAPNFTRHALSAICVGNGKFYTLTTGANERRWDKMKDRLLMVIDSFKVFNV